MIKSAYIVGVETHMDAPVEQPPFEPDTVA
jgi:hypothetical protein